MGTQISHDRPLNKADALKQDKLSRTGFATTAVKALRHVTGQSGFVLSIEGEWGSGKTSVLSLMEALLADRAVFPKEPIVVHFNPWLVGDRDALLRQFLNAIASKLELTDNAGVGKRIAKELKAYGKVFDVLKLIPGAEPWLTIVKSAGDVFGAVGGAAEAISDYKTPDLEARRNKVAEELRAFDRPIVVFIDDIDRLFPAEVFEMVRIIKAVGDLPNVGYVLAWDSAYVCDALKAAEVPKAESYLDKIVQVRLPLPKLSISAKGRLVDEAINALDPEATKWHFKDDERRISSLYFSGLRDLLEQPRDIMRVFNTVALIEPGLRGEISFADIVGLAALKVKAPSVFELLNKSPQYFAGRLPSDNSLMSKSSDIIESGKSDREAALASTQAPDAVRSVLHFLFPLVAKADKGHAIDRVVAVEGQIASANRLLVALQHAVSPLDVSLRSVGRYLFEPDQRASIADTLTADNCNDFLGAVADSFRFGHGKDVQDPEALCLDIARLIERPVFSLAAKRGGGFFGLNPTGLAQSTVTAMIESTLEAKREEVWTAIARDPFAISLAVDVLANRYTDAHNQSAPEEPDLLGSPLADDLDAFAKNVRQAARDQRLFDSPQSGYLLWRLAEWNPGICAEVMSALRLHDSGLDQFVLAFMNSGCDSRKGERFSLPDDMSKLNAYIPLDELSSEALRRLQDETVGYPLRAAWQAIVERKKLYAIDGSVAG